MWSTVRMRNLSCFSLSFIQFAVNIFGSHSFRLPSCMAMIFMRLHICRWRAMTAFVQSRLCFFFFLLLFSALLITSQSIGGSFMFAHFNIFRLFKCSFFTTAWGRSVDVFFFSFGLFPWKFVSILSCFSFSYSFFGAFCVLFYVFPCIKLVYIKLQFYCIV